MNREAKKAGRRIHSPTQTSRIYTQEARGGRLPSSRFGLPQASSRRWALGHPPIFGRQDLCAPCSTPRQRRFRSIIVYSCSLHSRRIRPSQARMTARFTKSTDRLQAAAPYLGIEVPQTASYMTDRPSLPAAEQDGDGSPGLIAPAMLFLAPEVRAIFRQGAGAVLPPNIDLAGPRDATACARANLFFGSRRRGRFQGRGPPPGACGWAPPTPRTPGGDTATSAASPPPVSMLHLREARRRPTRLAFPKGTLAADFDFGFGEIIHGCHPPNLLLSRAISVANIFCANLPRSWVSPIPLGFGLPAA